MAEHYLVLFDANHIKDYVFATGRLKEIRGASAVVREATERAALDRVAQAVLGRPLVDDEIIYAGGAAGALVLANEANGRSFTDELRRAYRRATGGATLSAIHQHIVGETNTAFAAAQKQAARALARAKASTPHAEAIVGGDYIRFCASDRLRPASNYDDNPDAPGRPIFYSAATAHKRELGSQTRRAYLNEQHLFWQEFVRHVTSDQLDDTTVWKDAAALSNGQDLSDIGDQAQPGDYIALVYADGDGIGKLIEKTVNQNGVEGYRTISRALEESATIAAADALAAAYQSWPQRVRERTQLMSEPPRLPFEVITIGGDDVLLICTGEAGLLVAVTLARRFGEEMSERGYAGVSASVGVVIAHASHPIVNLRDRAGELLKSAKRATAHGGGVDFHIVSTPGLEPIARVRSEQYIPPHGQNADKLRYTCRPYSLAQMNTLMVYAGQVAKLPGSKRAQLYDACFRNQHYPAATLEVLRIQMRLGNQDRITLLNALQALDVGLLYPFVRNQGRYETPLVDLLEAAEFVPAAMQAAGELS